MATPCNSTDLEQCNEFIILSEQLVEFGRQAGVTIKPYISLQLPLFSGLDTQQKKRTLEQLKMQVELFQSIKGESVALSNTPMVAWNAIKLLGLRPPSDLFSNLAHGDIIEIHNTQGIQIFRSFRFYNFCSYSLEELYTIPWTELYKHAESTFQMLMQISIEIFTGKVNNTLTLNWPEHLIKELKSPMRYRIAAKVKHIAPLFDINSGAPSAHLIIEEGRLLSEKSESDAIQKTTGIAAPLRLVDTQI